jgi:hypothetical protein
LSFIGCGKKDSAPEAKKDEKVAAESAAKEKEALNTAIEAYVYAYPLVTMEYTRRALTNTAAPEGTKAPMGQFVRMRTYPNASFKDVTAPNADTLYTQAWFDVSKEPWVVSVPDMKGRYFLLPMLDGWTTVFDVPGKRTTGTGAQTYAITGPGWNGTPLGKEQVAHRISGCRPDLPHRTPEDYKARACQGDCGAAERPWQAVKPEPSKVELLGIEEVGS